MAAWLFIPCAFVPSSNLAATSTGEVTCVLTLDDDEDLDGLVKELGLTPKFVYPYALKRFTAMNRILISRSCQPRSRERTSIEP